MDSPTPPRYRILEQVGAGGMGVVYRARDTHLERDVALKVLPPGLVADDAARRRFRREALALSQLNHPNVATVFDFESHEGRDFLVMEFLAGDNLDTHLGARGLPAEEVVRLGLQITAGLAAAHERGVIHCDLKPANLRIAPDGHLKIVDFGIARALQAASGATLDATRTEGLARAGTLAYMAPEVMAGGVADARSDLYAVGVVLYEMATGRPPFEAPTAVAMMYAVLNQTPPAPRALRPELPAALEAAILRALQRDPAARPASARELAAELARAATAPAPDAAPAAAPRITSLAVLPLENLSGDPAQEFFADGMTEALIADLAKLKDLRVISRTSAMRFRRTTLPLPEIARQLNVEAVIEGSVLRGGDRVRITAQLIHAATDSHLWAESYERSLSDVLALQSEVARAIAREIQHTLSPHVEARLAAPRRVDPVAYEAYLKGRYHWNRRVEVSMFRALDYFNQAIQHDPTWAVAYAGLADTFCIMGYYGSMEPREAFPRARTAAQRALEMDESLGEAHAALAYVYQYHDWRWDEAEREFQRALELNPGYAVGHLWHLNLLTFLGRFDEARAAGRRALELDPLSLIINAAQGWVLYFARDHERAVVEYRRGQELDRTFVQNRHWCGMALIELGRLDEATEELEAAVRFSEHAPDCVATLAYAHARAGRGDEARAALAELDALSARRYVSSYLTALVHLALGDPDTTFAWLERALEERAHWIVFLRVDPRLDPLRGDPRFEDLARRVGLPAA